jgi:hypothetical protein
MMYSSVQSWWTNPSSSRHQWCYIGVCNPKVCSLSEIFLIFFLKLMEASSTCMTGARCKIAILRYVYTLLKWSGCKEQSKQRGVSGVGRGRASYWLSAACQVSHFHVSACMSPQYIPTFRSVNFLISPPCYRRKTPQQNMKHKSKGLEWNPL